jgi:dihydroorotate dehydrogenase
MNDISIDYCGVKFTNPFVLPSGIITEVKDHVRAIDAGVGGVTLKSLTYEKREGNPLPRMWKYDHGMINSVGLRNAGIEKGSQEIAQQKRIRLLMTRRRVQQRQAPELNPALGKFGKREKQHSFQPVPQYDQEGNQ